MEKEQQRMDKLKNDLKILKERADKEYDKYASTKMLINIENELELLENKQ